MSFDFEEKTVRSFYNVNTHSNIIRTIDVLEQRSRFKSNKINLLIYEIY